MQESVFKMSDTLKALFRFLKREEANPTWAQLRDKVFASIYHPEMSFADVIKVLVNVYTEALVEPRFQMPGRQNAAEDLVLAPIKGTHALDWPGPKSLETLYSVDHFYGAMINKLVSDLRCSRIDWCRTEIWPEERAATQAA